MDADESKCKGIRVINYVLAPGMLKCYLHHTGHLANEDKKLDSLHPGSREVERGH
jgi:hypothetical protein